MLKIRLIAWACCLVGGLILSMMAKADYAAQIIDPNGGYTIRVNNNSTLADHPDVGSDGQNYYQVGEPFVIDSNRAEPKGLVKCIGRRWGSTSTQILPSNAFHRLFMYVPETGFSLGGLKAYRLNANLVMTVEADMMEWTNRSSGVCSMASEETVFDVPRFDNHFPITMTFYIKEQIIDGQLVISEMPLAGYVRAFTNPKVAPPYDSWSLNESSVPLRLAASQINIGAKCSTSTSSGEKSVLNLRHGQLNSLQYDNRASGQVTYHCLFQSSTKVRLRLDYTQDDDPQKRLPMTNGDNDMIYSELVITDLETGQSGKEIKAEIHSMKEFEISSHLQGENAQAGDYQGSAWLIATLD
ncbi:TPA: adhesin [Providencia alcalifaciens]